ncbi:MAG: hypothetical protein JW712_04885 [Dehalococcoidales bacterium]|nr:hypothetical protein [Dehalococcoidales bacterium]
MENSFISRYWIAKSMRTFHVILAVAAAVSYTISGFSGEDWLAACGDGIAAFGILHFFIHTNLHRKYNFSIDYHRTYSLPNEKIRRLNAAFLVVLVIGVCVGMVIARELYIGTLLAKLKLLFMYLLNKGFGVIFSTEGLGKDDVLIQEDQSLLDMLNGVAPQSNNACETTANHIQTIIIIAGLLVLVILVLLFVIGIIRRTLHSARETGEEKLWRETMDREEKLSRRTRRKQQRLGNSPADRIRRIYRHSINRKRRRGQTVPEWMTPSEIESMVSIPEDPQYRLLHSLYEKARYSEDGCRDQEAKQAKGLNL